MMFRRHRPSPAALPSAAWGRARHQHALDDEKALTLSIATAIPGFALAAWERAIDDVDSTHSLESLGEYDSEPDALLATVGTEEALASLVRIIMLVVEQMARLENITTGAMFERLADNTLLRPEARHLCADLSTAGLTLPIGDGVAPIHLPALPGWLPSEVRIRPITPHAALRLLVVLTHTVQHLYGISVLYQVYTYQDALRPTSLMVSAAGG